MRGKEGEVKRLPSGERERKKKKQGPNEDERYKEKKGRQIKKI